MSERVHVYTLFVPAFLEEEFFKFLGEKGKGIEERYVHTETRETR